MNSHSWQKKNWSYLSFSIPPHSLANEIQKYCKNELRFNGVSSRNNLPKIKDGAYVLNFGEYK